MSRLLYLTDREDDCVNDIIESILNINEEDKNLLSPSPIKLYINSIGGDVYPFFGLIDVINASITPIHTITLGMAMSCALLVAMSGHERHAYKNSTFMYHQISSGEGGEAKTIEDDLTETKRLQKIMDGMILSKTTIPIKRLRTSYNSKRDWFITADEALKYNIIDKII